MHGKETIVPRNGHHLMVGVAARISGCKGQKEVSLEDQEDHAREVVAEMYDGHVEYKVIATKGKGERLDRPELAEIEALLRSRTLDLFICEDLGRLVRGTEAARLCGIAVDHGVRVISPNDCIDTAEESWEEDVISACRDHVGHNAHTSKRLKQKLMNRFTKYGGAMARPIYGYIVPDTAKTYDDWLKDEKAGKIYAEWFRRLREKPNCSAVADWLIASGVPTGPYARGDKWTGAMVRRITRNPVLKGMPERGRLHTVKHHESGRRVAVANPKGSRVRECPHLAFIPPDEFDELNALLDAANAGSGRQPVNGVDPLLRIPRDRSRFPGRLAQCAYCGREYVWGGNGVAVNLMCNGARMWKCWNSVGISGALASQLIVDALTAELYRLDGFDTQFRKMVEDAQQADDHDAGKTAELARRADLLLREKQNLLASVKAVGPSPLLQDELNAISLAEETLARDRRQWDARRRTPLTLPASVGELRSLFESTFADLAMDTYEFADLLRPIVVDFHVGLVQLCDSPHLLPRAEVTLDLSGISLDMKSVAAAASVLRKKVVLPLFAPPQRELIRHDAVRLTAEGWNQRAIAKELSVTQAAVSKAILLDRQMKELGLTAPYVAVTQPPTNSSKMRRNANPRYVFDPLTGYPLLPD